MKKESKSLFPTLTGVGVFLLFSSATALLFVYTDTGRNLFGTKVISKEKHLQKKRELRRRVLALDDAQRTLMQLERETNEVNFATAQTDTKIATLNHKMERANAERAGTRTTSALEQVRRRRESNKRFIKQLESQIETGRDLRTRLMAVRERILKAVNSYRRYDDLTSELVRYERIIEDKKFAVSQAGKYNYSIGGELLLYFFGFKWFWGLFTGYAATTYTSQAVAELRRAEYDYAAVRSKLEADRKAALEDYRSNAEQSVLELQECENASELNPAFASMVAEQVRIPLTTVINEYRQARESLDSVRRTFEQTIHSGLRDVRSDMYSNITMSLESSEESNKNSTYSRALERFRMHRSKLATLASTLERGISNILTTLNVENLETQLGYAHMLEETLSQEQARLVANNTPGESTAEEVQPEQSELVSQPEQPSDTPVELEPSQETPSDTVSPETPESTETPAEHTEPTTHELVESGELVESAPITTETTTETNGSDTEVYKSDSDSQAEQKATTVEEEVTAPTGESTTTEDTATVGENNTATESTEESPAVEKGAQAEETSNE